MVNDISSVEGNISSVSNKSSSTLLPSLHCRVKNNRILCIQPFGTSVKLASLTFELS